MPCRIPSLSLRLSLRAWAADMGVPPLCCGMLWDRPCAVASRAHSSCSIFSDLGLD